MNQLSIGALKRTKWALVALVFLLTQFIPLYSLSGVSNAASTITISDVQGQNSDGTWTSGNTTQYKELDYVNFRFILNSSSNTSSGYFNIVFGSNNCMFFNNYFALKSVTPTVPATGNVATIGTPTLAGEDYTQQMSVNFTNSGDITVEFTLQLSDTAAECNGSSSHAWFDNADNAGDVANLGKKTIPMPADVWMLPKLTIIKTVASGTALSSDFSFTIVPSIGGISSYSIPSGSDRVVIDNITVDGVYNIIESGPAGYVFTSGSGNSCSVVNNSLNTPSGSMNATVEAASTPVDAQCVFVNTKQKDPSITIIKKVVNQYGTPLPASAFDVYIMKQDGTYQVNPEDGTATPGKKYTVGTGTFTVGETAPTNGYVQTSIVCTVGGTIYGASVTLTYDQSAICTITNTAIQPTIKLNKVVEGDTFGVTPDLNSFGLKIGETSVTNGQVLPVDEGQYAIDENVNTPGYKFVRIDGVGCPRILGGTVSVDAGKNVECTIVNKAITPKITLKKTAVNDNGGTVKSGDFTLRFGLYTFTGDPSVVDSQNPKITSTTYTQSGINVDSYALSEDTKAGYTKAPDWACYNKNGAVDITSGTVSIVLGSDITCEITNDDEAPILTLLKNISDNYNSGALGSNFTLKAYPTESKNSELTGTDATANDGQSTVTTGTKTSTFQSGTYNLSEVATGDYYNYDNPTGQYTSSWSCFYTYATGGTETKTKVANVTIGIGDKADCTVTNTFNPAKIIVYKKVVNDSNGNANATDFKTSIDNVANYTNFAAYSGNTNTIYEDYSGKVEYDNLSAYTEYSVLEEEFDGYKITENTCKETFTVLNGQTKECFITNDDEAPKLTVYKSIDNANGGNAGINDFNITLNTSTIDFTKISSEGTNPSVYEATPTVNSNTQYELAEGKVDGYQNGTWKCIDVITKSEISNPFTLKEGQEVACEVTNSDIAPKLTLIKDPTNNNGGNAAPDDFKLTVDGKAVLSGATNTYAANKALAINETLLGGYTFTSITGNAKCPAVLGSTITLDEGDDITCTITNDDTAPTFTVVKKVKNDNGGNATVGDFGLSLNGKTADLTFGVGTTVGDTTTYTAIPVAKANTDYTLSEIDFAGYTEGTWDCGAEAQGTARSVTVNLDEGQNVTCMITNDDIAPTLTVVKEVKNDNGGNATVDDFGIAIDDESDDLVFDEGVIDEDDVTIYTSKPIKLDANEDYILSEEDIAGYEEGTWRCGDIEGDLLSITLNLGVGDNVICTIANDDIAPKLTIIKNVVNDDGGTAKPDDFKLTVDGKIVTSGVANTFDANQALVLNETQLDGYTFDKITGDAKCPALLGGTITLDVGDDITCTITNNDELGEVLSEVAPPPEVLANTGSAALGALIMGGSLIGLGISSRRLRSSKKYVL